MQTIFGAPSRLPPQINTPGGSSRSVHVHPASQTSLNLTVGHPWDDVFCPSRRSANLHLVTLVGIHQLQTQDTLYSTKSFLRNSASAATWRDNLYRGHRPDTARSLCTTLVKLYGAPLYCLYIILISTSISPQMLHNNAAYTPHCDEAILCLDHDRVFTAFALLSSTWMQICAMADAYDVGVTAGGRRGSSAPVRLIAATTRRSHSESRWMRKSPGK